MESLQLIQKLYGIIQKFKNQSQVNFVGHNILGYDEHILSSCLYNSSFFPHITKSQNTTRTDSIKLISLATSLDKKILNKKWFSGAFLVIKKDAYKKLNGFDDKYFMYCEDMDLCYRSELLNLNFNYNVNFNIIHEGMYHSRKRIKYFFYHCKSHILFLMSVR